MPVLSPLLIRWIVVLAAGASLFGYGWVKGNEHGTAKLDKYRSAEAAAAVKIVTRQGAITERVVTQYLTKVVTRQAAAQTIEKEVVKYVESKPLALSCLLDMRWVRLHDAAAAGVIPPAPSPSDAAPGAFSAATALSTITANYGACGRNYDRLEALQTWVRDMAK